MFFQAPTVAPELAALGHLESINSMESMGFQLLACLQVDRNDSKLPLTRGDVMLSNTGSYLNNANISLEISPVFDVTTPRLIVFVRCI